MEEGVEYSKRVAEIEQLENMITKQRKYFNDKLKRPLMGIAKELFKNCFFITNLEVFKEDRLKVVFYRYSQKVGKYNSKIMVSIELRYKYRRVLKFEYTEGDVSTLKLEEFHACDWLKSFDSLCEYIPTKMLEDRQKEKLEGLKRRVMTLNEECISIKPLCEEEEVCEE